MALVENILNRYKLQTFENANQTVLYDFKIDFDPVPIIDLTKEKLDITKYVISISSIPSYSVNMDSIEVGGLLELNFPSSLSVTGTLSLTILDSHDFVFYKNQVYKYFINQTIFTVTLTITNLGVYKYYGQKFLKIPDLSFELVGDNPSPLQYTLDIDYNRFEFEFK